jgi:glyceraldehyde 3-phosphate dehydrogenase
MLKNYEGHRNDWIEKEKLVYKAIPLINSLWLEKQVELFIYRKELMNKGPVDILSYHRYARQIAHTEIHIYDTFPIIERLSKMKLKPSKIDVGRLLMEFRDSGLDRESLSSFLEEKLIDFTSNSPRITVPKDIVLYGFGRIGRLLARFMIGHASSQNLRLRAVVCRAPVDIKKRATLLYRDSVHGNFTGSLIIDEENSTITFNGCLIHFIEADSPDAVDYTNYGIQDALVIDNTGKWRDREGLGLHLKSRGVGQVLLTAPGKDDIPNIVYGVNTHDFEKGETIFSAASCTTNAIVPVLKVIHEAYEIQDGHIETVHSYTNDQNLLDNFHKKSRRGRSAPLNMVITETGAASAVSKVLPELTGKITGNAVRVPTANVSLAIMNLELKDEVTREEINETLRKASLFGDLVTQIDHTRDEEFVSSDVIGNDHPAIVDSLATKAKGRKAVVYVWYDNEYGYSIQVIRLARIISGVTVKKYF